MYPAEDIPRWLWIFLFLSPILALVLVCLLHLA